MNLAKSKQYSPNEAELSRRGNIVDLEEAMKKEEGALGEDPFPLIHHFASGAYAREIIIPKDYVLVGKIHKHDHFIIFLSGDVTITSEKGTERVNKPGISISPIGIKRALYAHEETRIITIHVTDKTDLDEIEEEVIAKSFNDFILDKRPKFEVLP